jgi:hypothetical protein
MYYAEHYFRWRFMAHPADLGGCDNNFAHALVTKVCESESPAVSAPGVKVHREQNSAL